MIDKSINTTIDILGKQYIIKCPGSEAEALQEAATYLNQQMTEVQESGMAINAERIAIVTALNITHQFLQLSKQKSSLVGKINQRIVDLQEKLDGVMKQSLQQELVYTTE